nr:hypothetical protein GCM10020093_050090 [Planobispora longispora]
MKVVGTPAEERGGGEALLLEAGVFDGVDAAMTVHPGPFETVRFRSFALGTLDVEYLGRPAHATLAPHEGRNAADAMTLAQVAIGLLRQQLLATGTSTGSSRRRAGLPTSSRPGPRRATRSEPRGPRTSRSCASGWRRASGARPWRPAAS